MELKLKYLHEDGGEDYLVRLCMLVTDALADTVVEDSIVRQCEECGIDVWYHSKQKPPVVLGKTFLGEVVLCPPCCVMHASLDTEPVKLIGPPWI